MGLIVPFLGRHVRTEVDLGPRPNLEGLRHDLEEAAENPELLWPGRRTVGTVWPGRRTVAARLSTLSPDDLVGPVVGEVINASSYSAIWDLVEIHDLRVQTRRERIPDPTAPGGFRDLRDWKPRDHWAFNHRLRDPCRCCRSQEPGTREMGEAKPAKCEECETLKVLMAVNADCRRVILKYNGVAKWTNPKVSHWMPGDADRRAGWPLAAGVDWRDPLSVPRTPLASDVDDAAPNGAQDAAPGDDEEKPDADWEPPPSPGIWLWMWNDAPAR